ncbi:unnamed protein product [Trifolium pratense]|uniref:Uncharacterized protein n=1 Tax=Trifolium pratense TaxID=57577 RepID=A0ACB0IL16_TRIPR|nr:unnamed protein product [Trifolium pratense]
MEKHFFNKLCTELLEHGLKSSKRMRVEEIVAMFLVVVGHGVGNKMIQERFQHSGETVSRHFHRVLHACLKLSFKYIIPEDPMFRDCHAKVKNDQRYWPFFKNAIGAIDVGYIGPYRCERYHLPEFRRSNGFENHNEVFNYYHSSLRCIIERTFGVWKNRFAILRRMPNRYSKVQISEIKNAPTLSSPSHQFHAEIRTIHRRQ